MQAHTAQTDDPESQSSHVFFCSIPAAVGLCALSMALWCATDERHRPIMVHIIDTQQGETSWYPWITFLVFCLGVLLALVELVKRAERAAARAEAAARQINPEYAVPGQDSDTTVMRLAARWGADVLHSVANGASGVEAVRRAVPRIGGLRRVPEDDIGDTGSEVSTDELNMASVSDPNDWIARASQSVTPVPDVQRGMDELSGRSVWNAAALSSGGTFIPGIHATQSALVHRPIATAPRPSRSPTHG